MRQTKRRFQLGALLCSLASLALCAALGAQTFSHILSFQGRLCGTDGKPLPDGEYDVKLRIHTAPTGGFLLWTEEQTVTQTGGVFDVYLGSQTAFPQGLFSRGDLWLSLQIEDDPEMGERFRLTPSPWAVHAANADTVDGFHASQTPTPNYILPLDADGMFPADVIPPDNDWRLAGNAGTDPASDYLGTSDAQPLVLRTNGVEAMRVDTSGHVGIGGLPSSDWRLSVESGLPGAASFRVEGEGSAGLFEVTNPLNTDPAVLVDSGGDAPAVKVLMSGTGTAGEFSVTNADNDEPALYSHTVGYGPAGVFAANKTGSEINALVAGNKGDGAAIYGVNSGHGQSAWFFTTGFDNPKPALQVDNNGSGVAIEAGSNGEGGAGRFTNWSWMTPSPALAAETRGLGSAGTFTNTNVDNTSPALVARNDGLGEAGVFINTNDTNEAPALYAESCGPGDMHATIFGRYVGTEAIDGIAVRGESMAVDYQGFGGLFESMFIGAMGAVYPTGGSAYYGLYGSVDGGTGRNCGVYGRAYGNGQNYGGYFEGDVKVTGYLYKDGGGFQIDHPLDPANMYLNHSFVESPDMKNVYDGVVVLDGDGEAWVELPEWFGVLNEDFRYQLTCIGGFAPVYIAEEIAANRFKIAGGTPGMKVSWLVTGIRHDPYAEAHRIPVEEIKPPHARGLYEHPELYGRPEWEGVGYATQEKALGPRCKP